MEPIVLIHGYSSESRGDKKADIAKIFGSLPEALTKSPINAPVVSVNISRYVSLDDSVNVDDITLALDRVLKAQFSHLLDTGFNAVVHSTGALVIRNWIRRCGPKPSPVKRIIHLAGANFGSGWAHVGESLLAKWLRYVGQEGSEQGLAVLDALELGSSWTLDLHHHFLQKGQEMLADYGTMEFNIIGSQVPAAWLIVPIRYGKEDGSDGVVRIAASNLNFHYSRIGPTETPGNTDWAKASRFARTATRRSARGQLTTNFDAGGFGGGYYEIKEDCRPENSAGIGGVTRLRPRVPLAIPYQCAHSSDDRGIVAGTQTQQEVLGLIASALTCGSGSATREENAAAYAKRVAEFDAVTQQTYDKVRQPQHGQGVLNSIKNLALRTFVESPEAQYDGHAQLIFRIRDQNRQPVKDYSIYFNSQGGGQKPAEMIDALFEDKHRNNTTPHTITFYLRTDRFENGDWHARLADIKGVDLEIDAQDTQTNRILFVPLRLRITSEELQAWIQPHRTTIVDVELLRLPSADTFVMF